ncbi:MAG: cation:proton antiporter, partial [Ignisphaera sp.]
IYVLVLGVSFAWLFRRIGLVDVVGYIIGGLFLALIMEVLGLDIEPALSYTELISWIGLVLFSFKVGASINFRLLSHSFNRLIASELVIILIQWIASGFIASALGFDFIARAALFFVLVNSSSMAVLAIERVNVEVVAEAKNISYIQTQLEDLIQFTLFSVFTSVGLTGLKLEELLLQVVKVGALTMLLIYVSRYLIKFLSRSPLIINKEGKFFTSIAIALIFTSIATLLGLPPLFGAFVSGIVFSLFLDLSDIVERLEGLKDFGLLLYFSSLGFQFYLGLKQTQNLLSLISSGILIGLLAYLSRTIGVFVGSLLSGYGLETCLALSLFLTPLSEVGIMFVDTLAKQGFILHYTLYLLMTSFLTSLMTFSITVPRLLIKIPQLMKLIPNKISHFINVVSREYIKLLSSLSSMLINVIVFTSATLTISYIDAIIKYLIDVIHLPKFLSAISTIISVVAILIIFVVTMKRILSSIFTRFSTDIKRIEALGKLFDIAIGGLAVTLQIQILHDFVSRYVLIEPLNILTIGLVIAVIIITLYDLAIAVKRL